MKGGGAVGGAPAATGTPGSPAQPTGGTVGTAAGAGAGPLDFLRSSPQFHALKQMVAQNPQILQPMLHELGKSNPELFRQINEHQHDFLRLLTEEQVCNKTLCPSFMMSHSLGCIEFRTKLTWT